MKKILIISYFYPPANFVGAKRTSAWAKYLHEFGYYPIIITRQWNEGQTDLVDKVDNNKLEVEKNQTHEVHRLSYKYSIRDRLANYPALKIFQKALTFKELLLSNYSINQLPFSNFYTYSKTLLQQDQAINILIASGRPFQSFFIGHQLKKDFSRIHWVPDYRDEWSTRSTRRDHSVLQKMILALDRSSERKWISNASLFTSVSKNWVRSIQKFTGVPGKVVMNGFESEDIAINRNYVGSTKTLSILYVGSIYEYQDFSILFNVIKRINEESEWKAVFTFLGSHANGKEFRSLKALSSEFQDFISIVPKVSKKTVQKFIAQNDLLFLTEYKNLKGCLPVKIFDYYNSDKPILLCPSDHDLMQNFIKDTNSGYIANSIEECMAVLEQLIQLKKEGKPLIRPRNQENAYFYSRKYQTKVLAEYLDELN